MSPERTCLRPPSRGSVLKEGVACIFVKDLVTTAAFTTPLQVEPPPAHSRNPSVGRVSTIQRNPFQKDYSDSPLLPVTAHSGGTRGNNPVSSYSALPSALPDREPPIAHSHNTGQFCVSVALLPSLSPRKPGKSLDLIIWDSRPGKPWNLSKAYII